MVKKIFLPLILTLCLSLVTSCGTDVTKELSSVHLEGSAKTAATTNKEYSETYDDEDQVTETEADDSDEVAYDELLSEDESDYDEVIEEAEEETLVWVSGSGKCYHIKKTCSNMKSPWQVSLSDAERMGRRPCKKCY